MVNAVNLQNEPLFLLQLGYGVCVQATCKHGFPSSTNQEEFWYTPNANGDIWAATWVDFNNDGNHDQPVLGRSYTFSITIGLSGTWGHTYYVKDNYTGLSDSFFVAFPYNAGAMYPWWGFERQNDASAIGTKTSEADIDLRLLKYSTFGVGVSTLSGSGYTCHQSLAYTPCSVTTDVTGYTVIEVSTNQH